MVKSTVSLIQMDIIWNDPAGNRANAERLIDSAEASDLYVLPEMFTTGFAVLPAGVAEKDTTTLEWMKSMAASRNAAIAGSVSTETADGQFCNRFYFVRPDGTFDFYDKKHLFTFSGEDKRYTAGDRRVIVEWRGIRYLLLVCYDLRFPVWIRNRGDYDAIICMASWPVQRITAWRTLVRARAIENQCWFAAVNRCGDDPGNHYDGATALIDPFGEAPEEILDREGVCTGHIDMDVLNAFREAFPVLNDADRFEL